MAALVQLCAMVMMAACNGNVAGLPSQAMAGHPPKASEPPARTENKRESMKTGEPDTAGLPRCEAKKDIAAVAGKRAVVVGIYHQLDVRMRKQGEPVYRGHAAVRLSDGGEVLLEPTWSSAALRDQKERDQFDGKAVEVTGVLLAQPPKSPEQAAQIMAPCVSPVEAIRGR